jgi:hypothetical protein
MRPTGHIRQRTPGSWELRYSLGCDPATGQAAHRHRHRAG